MRPADQPVAADVRMPGTTRISTLVSFISAVVFMLFFQTAKHRALWADVNPFAQDPYDAVGSFAVQFAFLIGLLSLIRAYRPYNPLTPLRRQQLLIVRGQWLVAMLVLVTLLADATAMLTHLSQWTRSDAGRLLGAMVTAFLGLTIWGATLLYGGALKVARRHHGRHWVPALAVTFAMLLALALYPDPVRNGLAIGLFAIVVGLFALLLPVWILGRSLGAPLPAYFEDGLDDLVVLWRGRATARRGEQGGSGLGKFLRRYGVLAVLLVGLCLGLLLALAEALEDGGPRGALVTGLFTAVETGGMLLGYLFLGSTLGLLRRP